MIAVETVGLVRTYPSARRNDPPTVALDGLDLAVEEAEVHGLLGPNGAGKTTLCKILATVLLPTSGTARVLGHNVVSETKVVKRSLGIVFGGDRGLYGRLTARQNLQFWAALYDLHGAAQRRRTDQLLERVGLSERADDRVEGFSRGMKQRLHLARGLVADPPVLLLDEPTVGMDPVAAHDFRRMVADLREDRRTVLLTTHDMAEAEAVCDRVTLIDHGTPLLSGDPRKVGSLVSRYERIEASGVDETLRVRLGDVPDVVSAELTEQGRLRVETSSSEATREILRRLVDAGVTEVATRQPSLEEVYLQLMGDRGMGVAR